jgi:hypothetical protein
LGDAAAARLVDGSDAVVHAAVQWQCPLSRGRGDPCCPGLASGGAPSRHRCHVAQAAASSATPAQQPRSPPTTKGRAEGGVSKERTYRRGPSPAARRKPIRSVP